MKNFNCQKIALGLITSLIVLSYGKETLAQDSEIIKEENLRMHMQAIASDATEGRYRATKGYKMAADYATQEFQKAGLKPIITTEGGAKSYFQPIPFIRYEYDGSYIEIEKNDTSKIYAHSHENFVVLHPGNGINKTMSESLVFIGYGICEPEYNWDDYAGVDVNGRWVVMMDGLSSRESDGDAFPDIFKERYNHWKTKDSLIYAALKNIMLQELLFYQISIQPITGR